MAEKLQAKLVCVRNNSGTLRDGEKHYEDVNCSAVYSDDPESPNYSFSQSTPAADLSMSISNPDAFDFFKEGEEYLITIEKAPKAEETQSTEAEV